jgi:hypothetical protein
MWTDLNFIPCYLSQTVLSLERKDCGICKDPLDGQQFIETKCTPKMVGAWNNIKVDVADNYIKVFTNDI